MRLREFPHAFVLAAQFLERMVHPLSQRDPSPGPRPGRVRSGLRGNGRVRLLLSFLDRAYVLDHLFDVSFQFSMFAVKLLRHSRDPGPVDLARGVETGSQTPVHSVVVVEVGGSSHWVSLLSSKIVETPLVWIEEEYLVWGTRKGTGSDPDGDSPPRPCFSVYFNHAGLKE